MEDMKIDFQDQIDKYVLGQMDDTEKSAFEQEVTQDVELQEQLQFTLEVVSATKSREEKLSKMKEWRDDYVFEGKRRGNKKTLYWISGIAAIFIAGFFLINNLFVMKSDSPASPGSLATPYSPQYYESGNMRGGTDFKNIELLIVEK